MSNIGTILSGTIVAVALTAGVAWGIPTYGVWQQEMQGKSTLARASQERQVQIEQARAERDAAILRAEAIQIVGKAAKDFPEYRTQEFMGAMGEALNNGQIEQMIYVPTEANIPITEATRLN